MKKDTENGRKAAIIVDVDMLVPKDHLLRKIERVMDYDWLYERLEPLYNDRVGRPGTDPVVLIKMVLIQHLYGIPSLRQTWRECEVNVAYRWFLGIPLNEKVPHFATISYNFKNRFTEETIEKIFRWILKEIERAGYLSPEVVFVDATHIKANVALKKRVKNDPGNKMKTVSESITNKESGIFQKGEHQRCFAYSTHTVCDKHNFILDTVITAGNVHDSRTFHELYQKVAIIQK